MKKIFILIFIILAIEAEAQDPHFTQFYSAPLTVNPAYTGVFAGNLRLLSNVRLQWMGSGSPIYTTTFGVDGNIGKNRRGGQHPFNFGLLLMNDNALNGVLQSNYASAAGSYHIPLDPEAFGTLGIGFSAIYGDRNVNFNKISFANQFSNGQFDLSIPNGEAALMNMKPYFTGSAGLLYQYADENKGSFFDIGISCYNFNKPKQTIIKDTNQFVPIRFSSQVSFQKYIRDDGIIEIRGIYQNQAATQYFQLGLFFEKLLGETQEHTIGAGAWYRSKDAVSPYLKLGIKQFHIGLTYDIILNDLKSASGYNSMEVSLQYIINKGK